MRQARTNSCFAILAVVLIAAGSSPAQSLRRGTINPVVAAPGVQAGPRLEWPSPFPIIWSPEIQISDDTSDAFFPSLARSGDTLHVCYYANGIFYTHSFDAGRTWSTPSWLLPADSIPFSNTGVIAASGTWVYLLHTSTDSLRIVRRLRVFRSSDAGITWMSPAIVDSGGDRMITTFRDTIYAYYIKTGQGPYLAKSVDHGATWSFFRQMPQFHASYDALIVLPSGLHLVTEVPVGNSLEVGYLRSSDFGVMWSPPAYLSTLDNMTSDEPTIASDGDSLLIVGWRDGKYGGVGDFAGAILSRRSTDCGFTWEEEARHDSMPAGNLPVIAVGDRRAFLGWRDEQSQFALLYQVSQDEGGLWSTRKVLAPTAVAQGVLSTAVHHASLAAVWLRIYTSSTKRVFAATGAFGTAGVTLQPDVPTSLSPVVWPNPFNSSTVLHYRLATKAYVKIALFDILGRQVKQLVGAVQLPGEYSHRINASDLTSGMYFMRMTANHEVHLVKICLLK